MTTSMYFITKSNAMKTAAAQLERSSLGEGPFFPAAQGRIGDKPWVVLLFRGQRGVLQRGRRPSISAAEPGPAKFFLQPGGTIL